MDIISPLPDDILGLILSFLPTKQAASTSLLSKRWRNVFLLVSTLDLTLELTYDYHFDHKNRRNFIDFVDSLLSLQGKSLIKKLSLKINESGLDPRRVKNWICNVLERGVVDLNLFYKENFQIISSFILKNNTLVKLRLEGGFQINLKTLYLPKLKTLCLYSVVFDGVHDDVFETLLSHCPVLEELVINNRPSSVKGHSYVSSRSLKKLIIRLSNSHTISLDAPNLVYLELSCLFGLKFVSVNLDSLVEARLDLFVSIFRLQELRHGSAHLIPADTIDIIMRIRNVRILHLTIGAFEMFYFSGQKLPKFDNLVCLCILSENNHGWQILPRLIKNSPNLETLIFKGLEHYTTTNCGDVCYRTGSKEKNIPSCLSSCRVKVLEIWGYKGEVKQMKHFLKNLPCLELVKIKAVNNVRVTIYLQTVPRASLNCKIQAII